MRVYALTNKSKKILYTIIALTAILLGIVFVSCHFRRSISYPVSCTLNLAKWAFFGEKSTDFDTEDVSLDGNILWVCETSPKNRGYSFLSYLLVQCCCWQRKCHVSSERRVGSSLRQSMFWTNPVLSFSNYMAGTLGFRFSDYFLHIGKGKVSFKGRIQRSDYGASSGWCVHYPLNLHYHDIITVNYFD